MKSLIYTVVAMLGRRTLLVMPTGLVVDSSGASLGSVDGTGMSEELARSQRGVIVWTPTIRLGLSLATLIMDNIFPNHACESAS